MASSATAEKAVQPGASSKSDKKLGFFGRIFAFLREVFAELKKVTTPTGRELVGYFFGVLFFVVVMLLLISGLDYLSAREHSGFSVTEPFSVTSTGCILIWGAPSVISLSALVSGSPL